MTKHKGLKKWRAQLAVFIAGEMRGESPPQVTLPRLRFLEVDVRDENGRGFAVRQNSLRRGSGG